VSGSNGRFVRRLLLPAMGVVFSSCIDLGGHPPDRTSEGPTRSAVNPGSGARTEGPPADPTGEGPKQPKREPEPTPPKDAKPKE
jgi:hypothetical protein